MSNRFSTIEFVRTIGLCKMCQPGQKSKTAHTTKNLTNWKMRKQKSGVSFLSLPYYS